MTSQLNIINNALIRLGCDLINDINQAGSKNAKVANQVYDMCRQQVLRMHPFNFSIKRADLASSTTAPISEYANAFPLPSDCLRVIRMIDPYIIYKLEGRQILTDVDNCGIIYISDASDPMQFDSLFTEALILKLAATMAPILTDSMDKVNMYNQLFDRAVKVARQIDGQEDTAPQFITDTWILSGE